MEKLFSVRVVKPGHKHDGYYWEQDARDPVKSYADAGKWTEDDLGTASMWEREGKVVIVAAYSEQYGKPAYQQAADKLDAQAESQKRKDTPIYSGVMAYFPDALAAIARVSKKGNDKHNPGEPLHWSRGKSNDHLDCVARHIITADEIDEDGETHLTHAAWRALAALQEQQEKINAVH